MLSKTLNTSVLAAIGVMLAVPTIAHAAVMTTGLTDFNVKKSAADATVGGTVTLSNSQMGITAINKFDTTLGVLTGATVNMTSTHTQSTHVDVTAGGGTGANSDAVSAGTGRSSVKLVVPNGVSSATSTITNSGDCNGKVKNACTGGVTSNVVDFNLNLGSSDLSQYAGAGTFNAVHVADPVTANLTSDNFNGVATTTSTASWIGKLSATYSYLSHAQQSFDAGSSSTALNLDFGTVYLGDSVASQAFSIFNMLGDRVRLKLTSITETDTGNQFSTDLSTFSSLNAGAGFGYSASFLAGSLGNFSATYELMLADVAPDMAYAANSLFSNQAMTLTMMGNVIARPAAAVPEPASLLLLGLGGAAFGLSRRRRKA